MTSTPTERAVRMLTSNRYLSLATCSNGQAWCAPLNYVIGPGADLVFYSAKEARHSRDITDTPRVVGSIFDSRAISDEVDGMQFVGDYFEVSGPELQSVSDHYFATNFSDDDTRAWWYRPLTEFTGSGPSRFYKIELREIYVINFESVAESRIDRRIEVPLAEVLEALDPGRR